MPHRKDILRELKKLYNKKGPNRYMLTIHLNSFKTDNQEYFKAFNQLLQENLITVMESDDLKAVAINPDKIEDVKKELRNSYTDPKLWIAILITTVIILWAITGLLSK